MKTLSHDHLNNSNTQTEAPKLNYQIDNIQEYAFKHDPKYRAERELNLFHFKEMMQIFKKCAGPTGRLSEADFVRVFSNVLQDANSYLALIFRKIDTDADNYVNWEDFSSFMILQSEGEKLMGDVKRGHFQMIERKSRNPHKEMIVKIEFVKSIKRYMTCCRSGTICYWNESFKLQRVFPNAG